MERRAFLQLLGGIGTSTLLPPAGYERMCRASETPPPGVTLDRHLLARRNQNRSTVVARNGMVAASQPLAGSAGLDVLKAGGSAVDAAIAANAMLGLVEPMSCGPGGDLFAIVWSQKHRKLFGLNASGRAPYDWSLEKARAMGLEEIPTRSPLAWSVPGCVSGWAALHERFGKLRFARLLEPSIHYGREGFPVSPIIARGWSFGAMDTPGLRQTYLPDGTPVRFGTMFRNPNLGRFYETLARSGPQTFYEGEIAERIVAFSKAHGGHFSLRDFRDHRADWIEPVSTGYRGYDVWELPPNGQGIAVLQMLNLLEHFDIGSMHPNSAEHLHLFLEAKKLAFEDRAVYYADMDFADVPLKQLISKEYAAERVKLIDKDHAAQQVRPGRLKGSADTIYLTAADREGNMVSLIQSIYYGWGSGYVPDGLGFCLQNRGQLFSLDPSHLNKLQPHKRPFHTIIPAFVTKDDKPVFSFGVMGGSFQPQGQVQVLMNLIDFGMSVQQAGEQPRVEHGESSEPTGTKMVGSGSVGFERGIGDDVKLKLATMGHRVRPNLGAWGGYQGIWRQNNPRRYFGGSDPRKDGCAIGY